MFEHCSLDSVQDVFLLDYSQKYEFFKRYHSWNSLMLYAQWYYTDVPFVSWDRETRKPVYHENHGPGIVIDFKYSYAKCSDAIRDQTPYTWIDPIQLIYSYKRCNWCRNCLHLKRSKIIRRNVFKFKELLLDKVFLWTFGTSELDFVKLKIYWRKFCDRMAKKKDVKWLPLLRVFELGKIGKRAHVHMIYNGYLSHEIALDCWRDITGEKSNVRFDPSRSKDLYRAIRYIVKYISKDGGSLRPMGEMIKRKEKQE